MFGFVLSPRARLAIRHTGTLDPYWGRCHHCRPEFTPPALALPAHVALLGLRFYMGRMFPPAYRNGIFIAGHDSTSWTCRRKIGYRVTWVAVQGRQVSAYRVFAGGWQQGETDWGRPGDVLVMPDGRLLVSDDQVGVVYRMTYRPHYIAWPVRRRLAVSVAGRECWHFFARWTP